MRLAAAVLEMTPEATIVTDVTGTIRLVNRHAEALFGYPREELLGQSVETLVPNHPLTATAPLSSVGVAIHLLGRRRDAHEFPIEIQFARLEQDGEPLLIASVHEMVETRDMARVQEDGPATDSRQVQQTLAVTDTALAHLDLDALLPVLLPRVRDVMDVTVVTILLLEADGQQLTVRAESHVAGDGPGFAPTPMPVSVGLAGRVASTRQPLIVDDVSHFPLAWPQLRGSIRSAMGVPLLVQPGAPRAGAVDGEQRLLGVLCVGAAEPRHFSASDVALLEQAAARIAVAIEHAQLFAAEQHAREEAERERASWHAAMESTPACVITCDTDLRITYVNPAYARLRGAFADPLVPQEERPSRYGLFLPDGEGQQRRLFPSEQLPLTRALREERPIHGVQMVLRLPEAEGEDEERVVEWDAAPMFSAQGVPLGAVAIGYDITEQRRMERAAQELAAQLQATFDAMADMVLLYDHTGRLLRINTAMQVLLGITDPGTYATRSPAERGQPFAIRRSSGELLPPDEYPIARALRGEGPTAAHPQELLITDAHGHERILSWTGGPVHDATGTVLGYVTVGHEITERKRVEETLRASEARFRAVFESAAIGLAVVDLKGRPLQVNGYISRMVGYSQDELRRLSLTDFTHPDDVTPNEALLRRVRDGELDSYQLEKRYLHKDGHVVWGLTSAAVVRDQAGQPAYFVVHVEDITQRKQLERTTQELAAQLQATLDTMSDAVFLYDTAGQVLQLNTAAQELVGALSAGTSASGTSWQERVHLSNPRRPDGSPLPPDERPLARVLRGDVLTAALAQDVVMSDAQGRDLMLNYRGGPARDATGRLLGYVFVVRDVTERRRLQREREEALVASEAWFRTLTDTVPALVWVSGPDGLVTFVNQPWLQFTGRTLEHELGDGWAEGVHPDDYDRCLRAYRTAFDSRQSFTREYRLRRADGEYRWLVDTGVPRFAPDGTFLGYIGSVMDISDRLYLEQEREAARAQAEQRAEELDRVFEAMADGVAVYNQDGQLMRSNTALQRLLGLDAAPSGPAIAQISVAERFALFAARDEHGRPIAPEEGPLRRALAGEVLAGARALDGRLRTWDGREVALRVSAAPIRNPAGQLAGAVCVYRDVTEHKRLERELAEQAEQLDRIVDSMGEGLVVYDAQGQVVRTNSAARRLLGLDTAPPEFYRLPAEERLARYAPRAVGGQLLSPQTWLALRTERDADVLRVPEARDLRLRRLDGRELEVSASMAPLRQPDGQVVGAVLLLSDRTERHQLMREREEARAQELVAEELAAQLDQFFAMAAHDIRSPLTVLRSAVGYARKRLQRLVEVQQANGGAQPDADMTTPLVTALDYVETSVQSLSRLVGQLFDVARARSGTLTLDLAALDLAMLVREQVTALQLAVPDRHLELRLPDRPVPVVGDAVRLGQVLTNYVSNALKYSADDQPVVVRLAVTDHVARLAVEDRGIGLSPEQQSHVWDVYQRGPDVPVHAGASADLESQGIGLGLGLYIVKRLVELHPDGQVGVNSIVGMGSTFWFTLPLTDTAPTADG